MYRQFAAKILPHLKHKVILISHKHDDPRAVDMKHILENPFIVHWFVMNMHFDHPKVTAIPIGTTKYLASILEKMEDINLR